MAPPTPLIVCGTDFSANARRASEVAAALARRRGGRLALVHFADEANDPGRTSEELQTLLRPLRSRLHAEAQRLCETGAKVQDVVASGTSAANAIVDYATLQSAELVVVSSVSKTLFERWTLGTVSERVAERSPIPTLVVRSPYALLEWANRERTLNVFAAVDFSTSSDAALAWVGEWTKLGGCAVTVAHVNWPPEDKRWLRTTRTSAMTKNPPALTRRLTRELEKKVRPWLGDTPVTVHVEPNWGRPDAALVGAAGALQADLVVTGLHPRHGLERYSRPSVWRGVLRHVATNIVTVPTPETMAHGVGRPVQIRRVLVATDFSVNGDQAVAWAFATLPAGGVVRLFHVLPVLDTPRRTRRVLHAETHRRVEEARRKLAALVPGDAAARGIQTELDVVLDRDAAQTISAEARRFGADLLCLGSPDHRAWAVALRGSVVKRIMSDNDGPLLVVRPPRP